MICLFLCVMQGPLKTLFCSTILTGNDKTDFWTGLYNNGTVSACTGGNCKGKNWIWQHSRTGLDDHHLNLQDDQKMVVSDLSGCIKMYYISNNKNELMATPCNIPMAIVICEKLC